MEKKDTPTVVFTPVIEPEPATGTLSLVEKEADSPAPVATVLPPVEPVSDEIPELEIRDEVPVETMTPAEKVKTQAPYDPVLDLRDYKYPKLDLLDTHKNEKIVMDATELEANKNQIISTLGN